MYWCDLAEKTTLQLTPFSQIKDFQDIGYIMLPSFVKGYQLTKNEKLRAIALTAAESLLNTVQVEGFLSCSWKKYPNKTASIDSLMNISLFLWSFLETNNLKYKRAVEKVVNSASGLLIL